MVDTLESHEGAGGRKRKMETGINWIFLGVPQVDRGQDGVVRRLGGWLGEGWL